MKKMYLILSFVFFSHLIPSLKSEDFEALKKNISSTYTEKFIERCDEIEKNESSIKKFHAYFKLGKLTMMEPSLRSETKSILIHAIQKKIKTLLPQLFHDLAKTDDVEQTSQNYQLLDFSKDESLSEERLLELLKNNKTESTSVTNIYEASKDLPVWAIIALASGVGAIVGGGLIGSIAYCTIDRKIEKMAAKNQRIVYKQLKKRFIKKVSDVKTYLELKEMLKEQDTDVDKIHDWMEMVEKDFEKHIFNEEVLKRIAKIFGIDPKKIEPFLKIDKKLDD